MADVIGWKLDRRERAALLERFPPHWPDVVADHVTLWANVGPDDPLPQPATGEIVGIADDGAGVEAMAVRVDGTTDRPDGSTYHITWSLGRGREAIESNDVLAKQGWTSIAEPVPVTLLPARWPGGSAPKGA